MLALASFALGVSAPTLRLARCLVPEAYNPTDDCVRGTSFALELGKSDSPKVEERSAKDVVAAGGVARWICSRTEALSWGSVPGRSCPGLMVLRRETRGVPVPTSLVDSESSSSSSSSLDEEEEVENAFERVRGRIAGTPGGFAADGGADFEGGRDGLGFRG